jgi:hypothetical protein
MSTGIVSSVLELRKQLLSDPSLQGKLKYTICPDGFKVMTKGQSGAGTTKKTYKYKGRTFSKLHIHKGKPCIFVKDEDRYVPVSRLQKGGNDVEQSQECTTMKDVPFHALEFLLDERFESHIRSDEDMNQLFSFYLVLSDVYQLEKTPEAFFKRFATYISRNGITVHFEWHAGMEGPPVELTVETVPILVNILQQCYNDFDKASTAERRKNSSTHLFFDHVTFTIKTPSNDRRTLVLRNRGLNEEEKLLLSKLDNLQNNLRELAEIVSKPKFRRAQAEVEKMTKLTKDIGNRVDGSKGAHVDERTATIDNAWSDLMRIETVASEVDNIKNHLERKTGIKIASYLKNPSYYAWEDEGDGPVLTGPHRNRARF